MTTLKHSPRTQARVVNIQPTYILLKEAYKYCGMEANLFRTVSREFGLPVYARGPKKIWHKVTDLDEMMESFLAINKKAFAANKG